MSPYRKCQLKAVVGIPDAVPSSSVIEHDDVTMHNSLFGGITAFGSSWLVCRLDFPS